MSVLAIIQARVGATRLPGKVLMELEGVPLVTHVIRRVKDANLVNRTILAIPDTPENDPLAVIAAEEGCLLYRGSETDVLSRFFGAAMQAPDADVIVRICGEDPFKDPELIDYAVRGFLAEWADPSGKLAPPHLLHLGGITWPLGLDVEVMTRHALEMAARDATTPEDREHVTPWIARTFGCWQLKNRGGHGSISDRWTIDTAEDLAFARSVYAKLYATKPLFGFGDMLMAGYCGAVTPQADGAGV